MKISLLLIFTALTLSNFAAVPSLGKPQPAIAQNAPNLEEDSAPQTENSPLVVATKEFLSLNSYQLESLLEISGNLAGRDSVSNVRVNTTVAAPNKFNSEITFVSPENLAGRTYQIISDGTQVWLYDLTTNQYSISDLKQFLQTRESFLLGNLSYFYLNTRSNIGGSRIIGNFLAKLPEDQLLRLLQRYTKLDLQNLQIEEEVLDNTTYKVYDIDAIDRGFQASAYINSQLGNLERLHLSGSKNGLQLASKERAIALNIPESIPPETFVFSPPEDAELSPQQIFIQPF